MNDAGLSRLDNSYALAGMLRSGVKMNSADNELAAVPAGELKAKRASKVAEKIIEDVIELGWPVGQILGSEPELLERYRVSRAVFREAVRLIEHQQVATTRRGPGGGLVITQPTVDAVIDAVVLYLYRVQATLDEVFDARLVLEDLAVELSAARLDEDDLSRLRKFVDDPQSQLRPEPRALHNVIGEISRNPAIDLFVDVLSRVAMLYSAGWQCYEEAVRDETAQAHTRIAEALMSGDAGRAQHRMRRHLDAEVDYLRKRRSTRQMLPADVVIGNLSGTGKLAEAVARRIIHAIVSEGLQPGQVVGSEPELIKREGVSRAIFREAIRLLEHHQIARMRRGPGGGLFVFEPSAAAVTDVVAIYLARKQMQMADLAEIRTHVETAIAGLAASNIGADGVSLLKNAVGREARVPSFAANAELKFDLHAAVASTASSRVLELIALVLIHLCRIYRVGWVAPADPDRANAEVLRAHEAIAAAVESGDRDLAMHRMRRHLDAFGALAH